MAYGFFAKLNKIKRFLCLIICVSLVLLMMVTPAFAEENRSVDPIKHSTGYSAVLYNNTNGLPTSEANDIAETGEGFIWIGSYSGLIRYDGNTFERIDSTTGITSVVSLHVDSKDRLWIGTNDNGLFMMDRGEFTNWNADDGLGTSKIRTIIEDDQGIIYVGTTSGITMIDHDMNFHHVDDPKIANIYIEQICFGNDGLLYGISNEDDFFTLKDGKLESYIDHNDTGIQGITRLLPDSENPGKLYIGTESTGFYHGNTDLDPASMEYVDISPLFSVIGTAQIDGRIWITANNGIGVLDGSGFHDLSFLPMNNSVGKAMTDYEGNLWFTSSRQGVMKLVPNRFQDISERFDLENMVVNSTCMYEGKLFIATDTGLVVIDDNGRVDSLPLTEAKTASGKDLGASDLLTYLEENRIRSIIRDSKNRLWISTWRGCGLLCYDQGKVTAYTEEDGLLSDHIRAVVEADDGSILVAHTGGVAVIRKGQVKATYGKEDGIENPETLTVTSAPNGDIILGSNGGGIYVINDDGVRCVSFNEGLTSGIVMRINRDRERNLFWLVTSNSIAYMDTNYNVTTIKDFPYSNNFDMYENSKDEMWIVSSDGLYVLPTKDLIANKASNPVHYGLANGLRCTGTSNSYSELTKDGDLYLSGNTGVVKVNINDTTEEVENIKMSVPFVEADGVFIYPDSKGQFTIPNSTLKLTVHAYIFNYTLTDPLLTYSLDGFDKEKITVNRSDLGPITYTNLKGGTYRFNMEMKYAMGRDSKSLEVVIVKTKALFEETWFYLILGLALMILTALLIRYYIKWLVSDIEQKHHEESERQRISNELLMAGRIQSTMIPHNFPPFPERKEIDIYASMDPAKEVGGDFYDFYLVDDDHLCLVMADVSGKGIPAALFMMISKVLLQSFANMSDSASEILSRANAMVCSNNPMDMFVTVWLGILELSTGRLVAANAGHEYPVIKRAGGKYEKYQDKHGLVIGGIDGIKYKEYKLVLSPGDKLFLYTDGVPEATASDREMFGLDRMIGALNSEPDASPEKTLGNVRKAVDDFVKDAEQFDDLTMLCLEYHGSNDNF